MMAEKEAFPMRIFGLVQDSIVDGPGFRFSCFVQGCPHHCPGCHNPESHDPNGGREMTVEEVAEQLLGNPLTDGLTLSGGEPFAQPEDCLYVGDSGVDMQTAKNAGVFAVGALWGFRTREELEQAGADTVAGSIEEILHLL